MMGGNREKLNVLLLAGAQSLFQTGSVMILTMAALAGQMLAPDKRLATLPVAMMVIATASLMIPAALFMRHFGRKRGFLLGIACGGLSGLLAAGALQMGSFTLFVISAIPMGAYQSCSQYYRFAAADVASVEFKSRAISWVIAGGVVAAIVGPALARFTGPLGTTPFVYGFLSLTGLALIAAALVSRLQLVAANAATSTQAVVRPLSVIIRQPVFITALTGSAVGFGVMIMVMTATPLAMQFCGQSLGAATTVIQWHVLGMFVPSFFTGRLIARYGVLHIMSIGIALLAAHVLIALSGIEFLHFVSGLVLLGVGWNFLFIGGTTLLTQAYRPAEQTKTQATHDFLMFSLVSVASLSAGGLLNAWGWQAVNIAALPFLVLATIALFWLRRIQAQEQLRLA